MLLTLTINVGAATHDERAHVSDLLARTMALALRHGHQANLSTVELDDDDVRAADDEAPTSPEDDAYRRGYRDGYHDGYHGDGYPVGYHDGYQAHALGTGKLAVPETLTKPTADRAPHRPPWMPGPDLYDPAAVRVVPNDHTVEVPGGADNPGVHLTDEHPDLAAWARLHNYTGKAVPPVFPDTLPAPEDTDPATWIFNAVSADLAAGSEERAAERTSVLPVQVVKPSGPRPAPGPGAPVSAFDVLAPTTAVEAFGFPDPHVMATRDHIDSEGAAWHYTSHMRQWERQTYPLRWADPSPVSFTPIHVVNE